MHFNIFVKNHSKYSIRIQKMPTQKFLTEYIYSNFLQDYII